MGRKGGRMFQRRRERTKREQEFWETRKREEQIYQTEKERNKEHEKMCIRDRGELEKDIRSKRVSALSIHQPQWQIQPCKDNQRVKLYEQRPFSQQDLLL